MVTLPLLLLLQVQHLLLVEQLVEERLHLVVLVLVHRQSWCVLLVLVHLDQAGQLGHGVRGCGFGYGLS